METKRENKMKMFISHSQRDVEVATRFQTLFEEFGEYWMPLTDVEIFLSSNFSNDQRKTDQWKANFEKNLEESSVFVVLVTPKSLNSRWVQYETGYVSAKKASHKEIEIFQIGIGGVAPEACLLNDTYIQIIKTPEDIIKTCTSIFKVSNKLAEGWYKDNKDSIDDLLVRCNEKCAYFVGSKPEIDKGEWKQSFVDDFLKNLTTSLLNNKIKVSSFPSVSEVGSKVFTAAITAKHTEMYEVAGLYGFDKKPEEEIDEKTWKETLNEYRKLYLKTKSSIIIIGGNKHTKDEYEVAEELGHIELFPIPCMGGAGEELFLEKLRDVEKFKKFRHPCYECFKSVNYKNKGRCDRIDHFTKRLGQYIFTDEDERES